MNGEGDREIEIGIFTMDAGLQNKVALVTGGAQGLGQAICLRLAMEGYHVAVADLNGEKAIETSRNIPLCRWPPSYFHHGGCQR